MLQTSERETEILLGNKQLLGIFFVVVVLLGVAFAGGYKLGQASKKGATGVDSAATAAAGGGQTREVAGTNGEQSAAGPEVNAAGTSSPNASATIDPQESKGTPEDTSGPPLGAPKHVTTAKDTGSQAQAPASGPVQNEPAAGFVPEPGQTFLQVAAVGRDEAEAVADVLRKKGFHSHAVAKPGSAKIYRVLIGPTRDAGDLSATRELLRKTGFREVIVQRY